MKLTKQTKKDLYTYGMVIIFYIAIILRTFVLIDKLPTFFFLIFIYINIIIHAFIITIFFLTFIFGTRAVPHGVVYVISDDVQVDKIGGVFFLFREHVGTLVIF